MASRGHAGGLASTSTAAAAVLDAAGFDLILIETVGTGQSEVEVAAAADTTVVLEAPEMGDEVQAIKAGLLEVADLVVVNKGDKPGRAADRGAAPGDARAVGAAGRGVRPVAAAAEAPGRADHDGRDRGRCPGAAGRARPAPGGGRAGSSAAARLARAEAQVWAIVAERLRDRLRDPRHAAATRTRSSPRSPSTASDPYAAADRLLACSARTATDGCYAGRRLDRSWTNRGRLATKDAGQLRPGSAVRWHRSADRSSADPTHLRWMEHGCSIAR